MITRPISNTLYIFELPTFAQTEVTFKVTLRSQRFRDFLRNFPNFGPPIRKWKCRVHVSLKISK